MGAKKNLNGKDLEPLSFGVRELRQSASQILDQVKEGSVVEITEHGIPVARLVPIARSLYEEFVEAGFITPASNPEWRPTKSPAKLKGTRSASQVLLDMRAEARY
jgi:prevent-host-death family protein